MIALNNEIAALVRTGVPLELGLRGFSSTSRGELGELTDRFSNRLMAGASLPEVLEEEGDRLPSVYRAVVETGVNAGRLPEALEGLTGFAQSVLELRRRICLACLYPGIVLVMAYGLFAASMVWLIPNFFETYDYLYLPFGRWTPVLQAMSESVAIWGPMLPLVLFVLIIIAATSAKSSRGSGANDSAGRVTFGNNLGLSILGSMPWLRSVLANFHRANFAELLALLIEHEVPLPKALRLAAHSTGDRQVITGAERSAASIECGQTLSASLQSTSEFPPFMRWMMSTGEQQSKLASSMRRITDIYRRRAAYQSDWFKLVLPILLVVVIGGGATLTYGLVVFVPLSELLSSLVVE